MNVFKGPVWLGGVALAFATAAGVAFAQAPASSGDSAPIDVMEFVIEGNTVLPVLAVEGAVMPFLGPKRQVEDVEAARLALEKAYQGAGYLTVFVDVPEQRVDSGVVILSVTEGRVDRLKVSGARYFSQGYIREKVPELAEGKVPDFNQLQRQLALVNRTEERRVQPIMRAGAMPGTVEAELKVDDRLPLSGSVEINNNVPADTKPWRLAATARYDNLFQLEHSIALTFITAPQDPEQSRVFALNYTIPGADQASWVGYLVDSNSAVTALGGVAVLGSGTTVGLRYLRPVAGPADESHSISLGFDYKDLQEQTNFGDDTIYTPLRYLPFLAAYSGVFDHGAQRQTLLTAQASFTFRGLMQRDVDCPGGTADQFACKRLGGDSGFATLRADLRHAQPIPSAGSMNLRLAGQVATGPLPSSEQYTIGGAFTVRGYYDAEAAGDRGVLGSLEWRSMDLSADLAGWFGGESGKASPGLFAQTYALAFADLGRVYVFQPAVGQAPHTSLASVGFGLRTRVHGSVTGAFDLAWPLKATAATTTGSPRALLMVAVGF